MIKIQLNQTNGTQTQVYQLEVATAPLREIWFSSNSGFHPSAPAIATNYVSGGDLISFAGRVVKHNQELTARLGFMPVVPDVWQAGWDEVTDRLSFYAHPNVTSFGFERISYVSSDYCYCPHTQTRTAGTGADHCWRPRRSRLNRGRNSTSVNVSGAMFGT